MAVIATPTVSSTAGTKSSVGSAVTAAGIADNFQSFLQLLTTQLKNQNPLDPLDTNQFTQQLVQFAQVEQQMKGNQQLENLVAMEKANQSTVALAYVGHTVVIDGSTAKLENNSAAWSLSVSKPATATITIKDSTGQTAYSGQFALQAGDYQNFVWDGKGNDGKAWPAGNYTLVANAVDASKNPVAVSTEVQSRVDSVDLTQNPVQFSIAGKNYGVDKIKRIVWPSS